MYHLQVWLGILCLLTTQLAAEDSILSNDFQMFNVHADGKGQPVFHRWTPSKADLKSANEIHIKTKHEIKHTTLGKAQSNPTEAHEATHLFESQAPPTKKDYIDLKRNITYSSENSLVKQSNAVDAVIEIVIICDKEFGDIFDHDNKRIMEYLTVYMWDVNLRYKTLPSNNLSFRVNGIVVISDINAQPFIEEARAPDGRAEFGRILEKYSFWVYSQRDAIPKLDMAPLITNTKLEWGGGLAYMNAACWVDTDSGRNLGTAVWNDNGGWGSVTVGAHEMGHNLGAPHDDDPDFPGGCTDRGYIMGGGTDDYRYFFSACSDRLMSEFVRSDSASCLQTIDGPANPVLDPSFSNPKAPTMKEECQRDLNNQDAYIEEEDTFNCRTMRCLAADENGTIWIHNRAPVENVICGGGGRCFRGRCRQEGMMFKNVGSGLCMRATNPFEFQALADMFICPTDGTPLERFLETEGNTGSSLAAPFTYDGHKENGEKCLFTGITDGGLIWTDRCNPDNPSHAWQFRDAGIGNGEFFLVHKQTERCAKPLDHSVGSFIQTFESCETTDPDMRWSKYF